MPISAPSGRPLQPDAERLQQLMALYQGGNAGAGADIVNALSPQMLRFYMAQVRLRSDAEDLLQELWLRIHNARATYRRSEPLLPWIYAIAHRVRIDQYRRAKRVIEHEVRDENALYATAQPEAESTGPELAQLLRDLPDSQREVLLLMKVSGFTLEEVARSTGTTVGAVKQKAHRAYETLRKVLGSRLGGTK